jgi:hypothetical protein
MRQRVHGATAILQGAQLSNKLRPASYIAFRRSADDRIDDFALFSNVDQLERWKSGGSRDADSSDREPEKDDPVDEKLTPESDKRPAELMDRFRGAMNSIAGLISFTSIIIPLVKLYGLEARILNTQKIIYPYMRKNNIINHSVLLLLNGQI